ncbi:YcaO-like family protein [Pseudomonas gingeri]|uniref:YcaO-like family protein n=1 Tax=Pseudomonas gingeri TaxID=117681 RepID=UPI0015A35786|nr:YcaO-like family protein [Pseudomonas gingeri]NWA03852.1 YcaO-like family protein [Pseudomonas gingeri]NWA12744.1 YcaO-like family protein [Pseudomonas gingeri]NWA58839.1 YcaO-like family protein [Pseudomonas gingeri]NWA94395.1 YcaO-like family protein [Pseudomonas gingeri]NWB01051.1 YcaO-like family protein [Pseudomonas gingeri]
MNIINNDFGTALPNKICYQPSATLDVPAVAEASDFYLNAGSGIGSGSSAIKSAIGEYFERRHFYIDIPQHLEGTLSSSLSAKEVKSFIKAFRQTNSKNLKTPELISHRYKLTKVSRLSDFAPCYIPTACISLSSLNLGSDNEIYPSRDTCGCSFHWSAEESMLGALKESLERQFLSRFWLTKKSSAVLGAVEIIKRLSNHTTTRLHEVLCKSGELIALDISDNRFPGKCLLVVYGQKNKSHNVLYCAGLSYAETEAIALEKATNELWQTFRFINLFSSINGQPHELHDPYIKHFLNCNSYETFKTMSTYIITNDNKKHTNHSFNFNGIRQAIIEQNILGYLYTNTHLLDGSICTTSKFISPDLFTHMDNSKNINTNNKYSSDFQQDIIPARKAVMVPFP